MSNQRAPGQKMLPVAVDEQFLREVDAGLPQAGYSNRSQFIRDAIIEKLQRADVSLPKELALPPHRFGKNKVSAKDVRYPAHRPQNYELNDKAASSKKSSQKPARNKK